MRDAKEIIEDMRTIVKPAMMSYLEKLNYQGRGDSDKKGNLSLSVFTPQL